MAVASVGIHADGDDVLRHNSRTFRHHRPARRIPLPSRFWHGAIGVSVCWAGGIQGLYDMHVARWTRRDEHSCAQLAAAFAAVQGMQSLLRQAALDIDAAPNDLVGAQVRVRSVRHLIEQLYIRQRHRERDRAPRPEAADRARRTSAAMMDVDHPVRTYLVTGSASGIGRATAKYLFEHGHRVITLDLHADVTADLGTPAGRAARGRSTAAGCFGVSACRRHFFDRHRLVGHRSGRRRLSCRRRGSGGSRSRDTADPGVSVVEASPGALGPPGGSKPEQISPVLAFLHRRRTH